MNHPKPSPKVFEIAGTEFTAEPKHLLGQEHFYEFNLSKDVLRKMGLALRSAPDPRKEVVKFLEQIISDPKISNRLFSPPYVNYSIFRAVTKSLLADLPEEFCEKLQDNLFSDHPQLTVRSAAVIASRFSSVNQFPDYQTFLHCFFKYDGITSSQVMGSIDTRLKACSDASNLKNEVFSINQDLNEVIESLAGLVGKIDNRRMKTKGGFEAFYGDIKKAIDRKEKKFLAELDKGEKQVLAQKVLGIPNPPQNKPRQVSLVEEQLPEAPKVIPLEPTLPDFIAIAKNPELLEQITPGLRKLCATNFIHTLSRKNINQQTQAALLKHLQIFASWSECDHLANFDKFMEFNHLSQKQLGVYYLLQVPEKKLVDLLQTLEMKDRNSGDLKRRLDINIFKVAGSFLKLAPDFNEDRAELKLDQIANRLKIGFRPSIVNDFWQ